MRVVRFFFFSPSDNERRELRRRSLFRKHQQSQKEEKSLRRTKEGNVKVLVRWATGRRLTNRPPKLSLTTLSPPSEHRDSWSSYGAVRAYSEVLYNLWGPRESDSSDS